MKRLVIDCIGAAVLIGFGWVISIAMSDAVDAELKHQSEQAKSVQLANR